MQDYSKDNSGLASLLYSNGAETPTTTETKILTLEEKKQEKIARLGAQKDYTSLDSTYTQMPDGTVESNANKVWNSYTAEDKQALIGDIAANDQVYRKPDGSLYQIKGGSEVPFTGDVRRAYMYGTTDSGSEVKFGLARGDLPSSDYRYIPGKAKAEGYKVGKDGYGWAPGEGGVDVNKNYMDMLLPYDTATKLEGIMHGNLDAITNRTYKDVLAEDALQHGSGVSEYYNSPEGLFGDTSKSTKVTDVAALRNDMSPAKQTIAEDMYTNDLGDSRLGESIDLAQAAGVKYWGDMADAARSGSRAIASELGVSAENVDKYLPKNPKLLGTDLTVEEARKNQEKVDASVGYDTRRLWDNEQKEMMQAVGDSDYATAAWTVVKNFDRYVATSAPEMAVLMVPGGGVPAVVATRLNNQMEEFEKTNGRKMTISEAFTTAASILPSLLAEKLLVKTGVGSALNTGKSVAGRVAGVGMSTAGEALQEGYESVQEQWATGKAEDRTNLDKLGEYATNNETVASMIAGGVMGGGLRAAGETASNVVPAGSAVVSRVNTALDKVADKLDSRAQNRAEEEVPMTAEQVMDKAASVFDYVDSVDTTSKQKIAALRNLEIDAYDLADSNPEKARLIEAIKLNKKQISTEIESLDIDGIEEYTKTLGSKASFLDLVDDVMEANDYVVGEKLESNLRRIAENFGIVEADFNKIKKDYETVDIEATKSAKGYMTQGKTLRALLSSVDPDAKEATKLIRRMQGFENSQKKYIDKYGSALQEMEAVVATYNKAKAEGKVVPAPKAKKFQVSKNSEFQINVTEQADGTYKVSDSMNKVIEAKNTNIKGIRTELAKSAELLKKVGLDQATTGVQTETITDIEGIADKGMRDAVSKTSKYFSNKGTTAYIMATAADGSRNYHLTKDNKQITNKGTYTENDVVGILSPNISNQKEFNAFTKEIRNPRSEIRKQIAAAQEAGATIVIEPNVSKKLYDYSSKSGKVIKRSAGRLIEDNIVGYGREYASSGDDIGKGKGQVLKPISKAKIDRDQKKKKANEAKATAEVKAVKLNDKYKKFLEFGDTTLSGVEEYFEEEEKLASYLDNRMNKEITEYKATTAAIKLAKNKIAKWKAEASKAETADDEFKINAKISKAGTLIKSGEARLEELVDIKDIAEEQMELSATKSTEGKNLLAQYRDALESDKITGDNAAEELVSEMEGNVVQRILDESSSKGYKVMYTHKGKGIAKSTDEDAIKHVLDINDIAKVRDEGTSLALLDVVDMFDDANGVSSEEYIKVAREYLKKAVTTNPISGVKLGGLTAMDYTLKDSPAYGLLFNVDGEINDTVVMAIKLGIDEYVAYNSRMLSAKYKTKEDTAQMLGIHESQLGKTQHALLKDKGVFKKTIDNEVGKSILGKLGLTKVPGVEEEMYNKLAAELGQLAGIVAVDSGLLEVVEVTVKEYTDAINKDNPGNKIKASGRDGDSGGDAIIRFIRERLVKGEKQKEAFDNLAETYEAVHAIVADEAMFRREPSTRPIAKSKRRYVREQVAKDIIGTKIADSSREFNSPKDAMDNLVDTAWKLDTKLVDKIKTLDQGILKKWLGFKTDKQLSKMSYEAREAQIATNRDIDKSIEELNKLRDTLDTDESLYFDWFYTSNGRYMLDSNTVNPQTDKQLHRWLVTPIKHLQSYTVTRKGKDTEFRVGSKNVTMEVKYALAQSVGFAVDKKSTAKIIDLADKLLALSNEEIDAIESSVFKEGKPFELDGYELEPEHVGHMLQGLEFLRSAKSDSFSSNLSAEFDAVTSGFGLKLLQLPILGDMWKWLNKVGIFKNSQIGSYNSMNDVLDSKGFYGDDKNFYDSYQSLAVDAKIDKDSIADNKSIYQGKVSVAKVYNIVESVLPKLSEDGTVDKLLRNLFKDPFMTFNYSAGIKSIRGSLSNKMMNDIVDGIVAEKESYKDVTSALAKYIGLDPEVLIDKLRTEPISMIKVGDSNLEIALSKTLDSSYGAKVEEIMTKNFEPFMETHKAINGAFKAMFEVFNVRYKEELAKVKTGALTPEVKLAIIDKLRVQFPLIKGPLSDGIENGIGVYGRTTVTPTAEEQRQSPAQTWIYDKAGKAAQSTARHMIKEFEAAMSAGSVVPIHYIDGALMAQLLTKGAGVTAIHDAIIPPLGQAKKLVRKYNENMIAMARNYSLVDAINDMLSRVEFTKEEQTELNKTKINVKVGDAYVDIGVANNFDRVKGEFAVIAESVKNAREELFKEIDSEGVTVGHMAAIPGSMWNSKGKQKAEAKQEDVIIDNIEYIKSKVDWDALDKSTQDAISKITSRAAIDLIIEQIGCNK